MTLPKMPRSLRFREAGAAHAPDSYLAVAAFARELAKAEESGELAAAVGERAGRPAVYRARGFEIEAEITLGDRGDLVECRLLDLRPIA